MFDGVVCVVDVVFGEKAHIHPDYMGFINIICDVSKWRRVMRKKALAESLRLV